MENNSPKNVSEKIPFWRDIRILRVLFQVIFLIAILLLAGILYTNMLRGLRGLGLTLNLDFLNDEAGFGISEGIAYEPSDTYLRAFCVGVINTIRVSIIGIVCATILGLVVGIARLSSNWLIRNIAAIYVECFRNIPLLLQILVWYTAVILQLPSVRQSFHILRRCVHQPTRGISSLTSTHIGREDLARLSCRRGHFSTDSLSCAVEKTSTDGTTRLSCKVGAASVSVGRFCGMVSDAGEAIYLGATSFEGISILLEGYTFHPNSPPF